MNGNAKLLALLDEYAQSFPFRPIQEQELGHFVCKLDGELSPLLRHIYTRIGRGAYFMTIPFFDFDADLTRTLELRKRLGDVAGYQQTGRELIVGSADEDHLPGKSSVFFVSDYSTELPYVYCISTVEGEVVAMRSLNEIVLGFRGFPDCKNVPQGLFDYYWYMQHFQVPANHNPVELSISIMKWSTSGRIGMDGRFTGHPAEQGDVSCDATSVFSPFYYL